MTPTTYPLSWPAFRARTPPKKRKRGGFTRNKKPIRLLHACDRLEEEVERLGGVSLIISSNVEPTLSGRPNASKAAPEDPGVAIYFMLDDDPITLAGDTYASVAQNLAGLAAHIDCTRRIGRYGVQSAKETLQAFSALPPPESARRNWWDILGVPRTASQMDIERAFRKKAKTAHPDGGGSTQAFQELSDARETGLRASAA